MLSYKARTFYKYWQGRFITSFPKQHTEPAVEAQGRREPQNGHVGAGPAESVLGGGHCGFVSWVVMSRLGSGDFGAASYDEVTS